MEQPTELTHSPAIAAKVNKLATAFKAKLLATIAKKNLIKQRELANSVRVEVEKLPDGWKIAVSFAEHGRIVENLSYRRDKIAHKDKSLIYSKPTNYRWYRRNAGQFVEQVIGELTQEFADELMGRVFHVLDYFEEG